jgi:transcriptional regulator with XRE-family HTH domain
VGTKRSVLAPNTLRGPGRVGRGRALARAGPALARRAGTRAPAYVPGESAVSARQHDRRMNRRSGPTREIERRLATSIAKAVTSGRTELGWSKGEVARRAGVSASVMSHIEAGSLKHVGLGVICAVLEVVGVDARLFLDGPTVLTERLQHDGVHARLCGHLAGRLAALEWETAVEVEVSERRIRGFVDVMAFRPADRALICDETKSEIHDSGAIIRTLRWYANHAWDAARALGWRPARIVPILTVLDSDDVATRLRENRALIDRAFPVRAGQLGAWIEDHRAPLPDGFGLAALDPASRRRAWLRVTALDARRVVPPYRNYADFAEGTRR